MESWNGIGKAGKGLQEDEIQPLIPQHLNQLKHSNEYHVQSLLKESGVLEISWSAQKIPGFAINAQRNRDVHGNAANSPKKNPLCGGFGLQETLEVHHVLTESPKANPWLKSASGKAGWAGIGPEPLYKSMTRADPKFQLNPRLVCRPSQKQMLKEDLKPGKSRSFPSFQPSAHVTTPNHLPGLIPDPHSSCRKEFAESHSSSSSEIHLQPLYPKSKTPE